MVGRILSGKYKAEKVIPFPDISSEGEEFKQAVGFYRKIKNGEQTDDIEKMLDEIRRKHTKGTE